MASSQFQNTIGYVPMFTKYQIAVKSQRPFAKVLLLHNCLKMVYQSLKKKDLHLKIDGKELWIYPVLLAGRCDLKTQYPLARQYNGGYEKLQHGCNNCDIPGEKLHDYNTVVTLRNKDETELLISSSIVKIVKGIDLAKTKEKLKAASLHAVPVRQFSKQT